MATATKQYILSARCPTAHLPRRQTKILIHNFIKIPSNSIPKRHNKSELNLITCTSVCAWESNPCTSSFSAKKINTSQVVTNRDACARARWWYWCVSYMYGNDWTILPFICSKQITHDNGDPISSTWWTNRPRKRPSAGDYTNFTARMLNVTYLILTAPHSSDFDINRQRLQCLICIQRRKGREKKHTARDNNE